MKDDWNNMLNKINNCEKDIKEIKENNINENIINKRKDRKEKEENIDINEYEEINTNKIKKGNKKTYKRIQECIKDKIDEKKLKICKICLGKNHNEENCKYKDFNVCKKCGFFHIGCTCIIDYYGLLIYHK